MDEQHQSRSDTSCSTTSEDSLIERAIQIGEYKNPAYVSDEELVVLLRKDIHGGGRKHVNRLFPILQARCSRRIGLYMIPYPKLPRDPIETRVLGKVTELLLKETVPNFALERFGLWFKRRFISARRAAVRAFKKEAKHQQEQEQCLEDAVRSASENAVEIAVLIDQLSDQLTSEEWELLLMHRHHGLMQKEITQILGCSDKTTYNRLQKLQQRVNEILRGDENAD